MMFVGEKWKGREGEAKYLHLCFFAFEKSFEYVAEDILEEKLTKKEMSLFSTTFLLTIYHFHVERLYRFMSNLKTLFYIKMVYLYAYFRFDQLFPEIYTLLSTFIFVKFAEQFFFFVE